MWNKYFYLSIRYSQRRHRLYSVRRSAIFALSFKGQIPLLSSKWNLLTHTHTHTHTHSLFRSHPFSACSLCATITTVRNFIYVFEGNENNTALLQLLLTCTTYAKLNKMAFLLTQLISQHHKSTSVQFIPDDVLIIYCRIHSDFCLVIFM